MGASVGAKITSCWQETHPPPGIHLICVIVQRDNLVRLHMMVVWMLINVHYLQFRYLSKHLHQDVFTSYEMSLLQSKLSA